MKIAIVICVEKGVLESQAKLLINSVEKFNSLNNISLIAFSPRKDFIPSADTLGFFKNHNIIHITEDINQQFLDYPIANKVLACEFIEINYPEFDSIIFIDTDTVFINSLSAHLIHSKGHLYLRPVDNKGPGSTGENDENDLFWQNVYRLFGTDLPESNLVTTVRPNTIRPYYNAGFIWANGLPGFFQQWKKDFVKLVNSGLRPYGYQSRDNTDFRCLDQVALSVTAQRYNQNIEILPESYNYPIPFQPLLKDRENHPRFYELIHIHYHKWFQHPGFLDHVTSDEDKKSEQYLWLKEQLPLLPEMKGDFKC